jgi:Got1/Sft2-like family
MFFKRHKQEVDGGGGGGGDASWLVTTRSWFGNVDEEEGCLPALSYRDRMLGFGAFLVLGLLCCFLSTFFLISPRTFAKWYSVGSMCLIVSSFFLVGPLRQLKTMFAPKRASAALVYVLTLAGTVYVALVIRRTGLTLAMVILQFGAALFYGASFIPYGQKILGWSMSNTVQSILPL